MSMTTRGRRKPAEWCEFKSEQAGNGLSEIDTVGLERKSLGQGDKKWVGQLRFGVIGCERPGCYNKSSMRLRGRPLACACRCQFRKIIQECDLLGAASDKAISCLDTSFLAGWGHREIDLHF